MDSLLPELIQLIFTHISKISKISDKRFFMWTCKSYNLLLHDIITNIDKVFIIKDYCKFLQYKDRFIVELCYDDYFHLLPQSYITSDNQVLIQAASMYGTSEFLLSIINNHETFNRSRCRICEWDALGGNLELLK